MRIVGPRGTTGPPASRQVPLGARPTQGQSHSGSHGSSPPSGPLDVTFAPAVAHTRRAPCTRLPADQAGCRPGPGLCTAGSLLEGSDTCSRRPGTQPRGQSAGKRGWAVALASLPPFSPRPRLGSRRCVPAAAAAHGVLPDVQTQTSSCSLGGPSPTRVLNLEDGPQRPSPQHGLRRVSERGLLHIL